MTTIANSIQLKKLQYCGRNYSNGPQFKTMIQNGYSPKWQDSYNRKEGTNVVCGISHSHAPNPEGRENQELFWFWLCEIVVMWGLWSTEWWNKCTY